MFLIHSLSPVITLCVRGAYQSALISNVEHVSTELHFQMFFSHTSSLCQFRCSDLDVAGGLGGVLKHCKGMQQDLGVVVLHLPEHQAVGSRVWRGSIRGWVSRGRTGGVGEGEGGEDQVGRGGRGRGCTTCIKQRHQNNYKTTIKQL